MPVIAIYADPFTALPPQTDGTLRMAYAAQQRGFEVVFFTTHDISLTPDGPQVAGLTVTLHADYTALSQAPCTLQLNKAAFILIRKDPPVDEGYINTLLMLQLTAPHVPIINGPQALLTYREKTLPLCFPALTPPTLITTHRAAIEQFRRQHPDIVIKPLNDFGGRGVVRVQPGEALNLSQTKGPFVVQPFLPAVLAGEKRVVMFDGTPVLWLLKVPAEHDFRGNSAQGARLTTCTLSAAEHQTCLDIGQTLKKNGIFFAGLDMIDGLVTEINFTSVGLFTGFKEFRAIGNIDIATLFWEHALKAYPTLANAP
jgi:glutathione synthase